MFTLATSIELSQTIIDIVIGVVTLGGILLTVGKLVGAVQAEQRRLADDHKDIRKVIERLDNEQRDETKLQLQILGDLKVLMERTDWIKQGLTKVEALERECPILQQHREHKPTA